MMNATGEEPTDIVNFTEHGGVQLNVDALARVLCQPAIKDKPLVVIGIAGPLRTGKSFVLSFLMRYLRNRGWENPHWIDGDETCADDGIKWQYGRRPHTKGILIWNEVFSVKDENGEELAVLLVDTQGLFDQSMTKEENTKIFSLTVLLCSFLMLNVKDQINEREIESLELFTEFSRTVAGDAAGKTPFQDLMFLVRDWQYAAEDPYGTVGGETVLVDTLRTTGREQLDTVRRNLRSAFRHISCFLMPNPGDCVKNPEFKGRNADIKSEFLDQVQDLAKTVFDPLKRRMRTYNGRPITGRQIWALLKACNSNFQQGKVPRIENMTVTVARMNNRLAYEESLETFEKKLLELQDQGVMVSDDTYKDVLGHSLKQFDEKTNFGGEDIRREYRMRLISGCQKHFKTLTAWDELRKIRARNTSSQKIHELWFRYKESMTEDMGKKYQPTEKLNEMHRKHLESALTEYQTEVGGEAAFDETHMDLLHKRIILSYKKFKEQSDLKAEYEAYLLFHQIAQQFREDVEQFSVVYIEKEKLEKQLEQLQTSYQEIFETNWNREGPNINSFQESLLRILAEEYDDCIEQNERNKDVFYAALEESEAEMRAQYRETMDQIVKHAYCDPEELQKAHEIKVKELIKNLQDEIAEVDVELRNKVLDEARGALASLYEEVKRANEYNEYEEPPQKWDAIAKKLATASAVAVGATFTIQRFTSTVAALHSTYQMAQPVLRAVVLPSAEAVAAALPYVAIAVGVAALIGVTAYCVYKYYQHRKNKKQLSLN